jgi:D-arabinose 5-phosphate isomerase GutQ
MKDSSWEFAKKSFSIEAESIQKALDYLERGPFSEAVIAIKEADRVAISGCGHSGIACEHFAHSLCCIEIPARFLSPSLALHGGIGFIKEGDVIVLASRGGKTSELLPIQEVCKQKGATIICITENLETQFATNADIVIKMHVERENDKFNSQGTSSFVVLAAIFDSLQVALLEETNFKNEQFAVIHPGGAVGDRLNH